MTLADERRIAEAAASVRTYTEEYAEFIATFNPAKVLELIDELDSYRRSLRKVVDRNVELAARLAAVEKLHQPEVLHGKTYCSRSMYQEYAGGPYHGTPWPCDTIKAARGE